LQLLPRCQHKQGTRRYLLCDLLRPLRKVKRIYGHLGAIRHRSEVVEYRIENHEDLIGDRLNAL